MNEVTTEQKNQVMKTMAIVGFVFIIILSVWLAVQIVRIIPHAFTSLASIADGVYNYRVPTALNITTPKTAVNTGETFTISWDEATTGPGSYTFSYTCADGVSVEVTDNTGSSSAVNCGEMFTLGNEVATLSLTIASERNRFTDVHYEVAFVPQGATEAAVSETGMVTIINASIPSGGVVAETPEETEETEETEPEPEVATETPVVWSPKYIETITYGPATSDPNGYTDLSVRLVAVGHLDSRDNFSARSNIDQDARGAFQFEVKNIGTKVSNDWEFEAILPSGMTYPSGTQKPLMPQERVTFTLGFDNVGEDGLHMIGVSIDTKNERNADNNSFTWAVNVI